MHLSLIENTEKLANRTLLCDFIYDHRIDPYWGISYLFLPAVKKPRWVHIIIVEFERLICSATHGEPSGLDDIPGTNHLIDAKRSSSSGTAAASECDPNLCFTLGEGLKRIHRRI